MTRRGRYVLRLLVVAAVIAALVGLGYLWRSSSLASIVSDGRGNRSPREGGGFRGSGPAFSLSNIGDLATTMAIGVAALVFVVLVDKARRRRRPIRPVAVPIAAAGTAEIRDGVDANLP